MARSACNTAVSREDLGCVSFSRIRARTAAMARLTCPSSAAMSVTTRSRKVAGRVMPFSITTLPSPTPGLTGDPKQHRTSAASRVRGSVPLAEIRLIPAKGTSQPGRTCSIKRSSAVCAACSSVPRTCTVQRSPCLTSAEMIASTLFRLPTEPVRRFVKRLSEAKSFATSARWLAGLACKPSDKEQTNANSSDVLALCVISGLNLGEDGKLRLADVILRQLVFNAHGTLRLNFDFKAERLGDLLQSRGRHISVGDARRAGSDRNNLHAAFSSVLLVSLRLRAFSRLTESAVT